MGECVRIYTRCEAHWHQRLRDLCEAAPEYEAQHDVDAREGLAMLGEDFGDAEPSCVARNAQLYPHCAP